MVARAMPTTMPTLTKALGEAFFGLGPLLLLSPPPLLLLSVGAVGVADGVVVSVVSVGSWCMKPNLVTGTTVVPIEDVIVDVVVDCCHPGQLAWLEGQIIVSLVDVV